MRIRVLSSFGVVAVVLALPACEQKQTAPPPERTVDAGAPTPPGVDKNLADAVRAVAGGAAAQAGPPPNGVFAPGAADKEVRPGELPKISVGNKGQGPTIQFAITPKPGKKLDGKVEVAVQTGPRSAMPTMELGVSFEADKVDPAAPPTTLLAVSGKVTSAKLAAEQPGELPAGLDKVIAKARGSRIAFELTSAGAGRPVAVVPSKDLDPSFTQVLATASTSLAVAFLPYPTEPVGVGAFWMVTSREAFAGLDVVVYRMMKLEKIEAGTATIDVSAKRFVAGGRLAFEGLPPHRIAEFSGNTAGKLEVSANETADVRGELTDVLLAALEPEGAPPPNVPPGQKMSVHIEMRSRLAVVKP